MLQSVTHIPAWERHFGTPVALSTEPCIHPTAIVADCRIGAWTEIGAYTRLVSSTLDDYSYIAPAGSDIMYARIGKFASVAAGVRVNPVQHPMQRVTQHHCTYRRRQYGFDTVDDEEVFTERRNREVWIGHDTWLGHGSIIMPGITVGTGAVVGAGAVVTKDVAPYTIVAGVPAKVLRRRFPETIAHQLLTVKWWEWPHETLQARFPDLFNVERFLEMYA